MTTRRALFLPLALAPAAGWAIWRVGEAEPQEGVFGAGAVHGGGGLHLGDDATTSLWRELMKARRDDGPLAPPRFSPVVTELDGRPVALRGYMIALQEAPAHRRFLFAPNPPGCPGCRPLGAFSLLDVRGDKPLPTAADPILLRGVLRLRRHDELAYRLDGAVIAG